MSQIDRWNDRERRKDQSMSLKSLDEKDIRQMVRRILRESPDLLPAGITVASVNATEQITLPGDEDLQPEQTIMVLPPEWSGGIIRYVEDEHQADPTWGDHEELVSDGNVPDAVTAVTVNSGKAYLHVKWPPVLHPHAFDYNVHVDTSAAFTPSAENLVTKTRGDQVWVRALMDGTPLTYGVTYYVQITTQDVDGVSAASPEASGALDANAPGDVTFGSITAQQLEAMLVLATTVIAGNEPPGSRVEFGITEHDETEMVGLHAFDSENMLTFMIDANTGQVYIKGTVDFGSGSHLMSNDIIDLLEQAVGFQIPALVQSAGNKQNSPASTITCNWSFPTVTGNALFMLVTVHDADGTAPTPSAPSGWTTVTSKADGQQSMVLMRASTGASRSGTETVTFGDSCSGTLQLFEYSGVVVGAADKTATNSGTSTTFSTGTTATTTSANQLWLAFACTRDTSGPAFFSDTQVDSPTNGFAWFRYFAYPVVSPQFYRYQAASAYSVNVASTGAASMSGDLDQADHWLGLVATFPAKAAGVETPDAGHLRVYAQDVNDVATLHTVGEDGTEQSVVLGPANEKYVLITFSGTINPGSLLSQTGELRDAAVTGLAVGDVVVGFVYEAGNSRAIQIRPVELTVDTTDALGCSIFNGAAGTIDFSSVSVQVTVIRRTT